MTKAYDDRLVKLTIQLLAADNKTVEETFVYDQRYYITAVGEKYGAPNLGIGKVRIDNIKKNVRDHLITKTSLYTANATLPQAATLSLDVGRASLGLFRLFTAQVIAGMPTQPPDIGLTFSTMAGAALLASPLAITMPENSFLSAIAAQTAQNLGMTLSFQATDKQINNYAYNGAATKQLQKLQEAGNVDAFIDNNVLIVKDTGMPRQGPIPIIQSPQMVGVPQLTERGVAVTSFINSEVKIGGSIQINSLVNPTANGIWKNVSNLGFNIASRDTPFYWFIQANNSPIGRGYAA